MFFSPRFATNQGTRGTFEVEKVNTLQIRGSSCISQYYTYRQYDFLCILLCAAVDDSRTFWLSRNALVCLVTFGVPLPAPRSYSFSRPPARVYCALPLYHSSGGMLGVGGCWRAGCSLVVRRRFSVRHFSPDCVMHRCTVVQYIGEVAR